MYKKVVVFDLDDTLYKEIDFLKSGYRKIANVVEKQYGLDSWGIYEQLMTWYHNGKNAFACLNEKYGIEKPIEDYLNVYRYHLPDISLSDETKSLLERLNETGFIIGIITDGRMITQKQKVEALGLTEWISMDKVLINEDKNHFKPNHWSFNIMMARCYEQSPNTEHQFYYVGDNPEKDFEAPNQLGWTSICLLDNGKNIHKQNFNCEQKKLPKKIISNIVELIKIV